MRVASLSFYMRKVLNVNHCALQAVLCLRSYCGIFGLIIYPNRFKRKKAYSISIALIQNAILALYCYTLKS